VKDRHPEPYLAQSGLVSGNHPSGESRATWKRFRPGRVPAVQERGVHADAGTDVRSLGRPCLSAEASDVGYGTSREIGGEMRIYRQEWCQRHAVASQNAVGVGAFSECRTIHPEQPLADAKAFSTTYVRPVPGFPDFPGFPAR
jgi:hypothetical protein